MFKIISKKRYESLKSAPERMQKRFDEVFNQAKEEINLSEARYNELDERFQTVQKCFSKSESHRQALAADCDKYKGLYADELYKRVLLAEKVRELEEHIEKLENSIHDSAKQLSEVRQSIPFKIKQVKRFVLQQFTQHLKCGVPQETGIITCKDVDETFEVMKKELGIDE